ncbi:MAG: hypothetical protein ACK5JT_13990 [Hyphomicrobiaceae bacterium]
MHKAGTGGSRRNVLSLCRVVAVLAALPAAGAWAQGGKPHLPSAKPSLTSSAALAIIGQGIDYRDPVLAAGLLRDGEGEAVAWDVAANDPKPYAAGGTGDGALARLILQSAPGLKLVIVKTPDNVAPALAPALQFVASTPASVALLVPKLSAPIHRALLEDAATRLPNLLLVVPARLVTGGKPAASAAVLVAADAAGSTGAGMADLFARRAGSVDQPHGQPPSTEVVGDAAAAEVAALAAQIAEKTRKPDGKTLKQKILSLLAQVDGKPVIDITAARKR